MAVVVLVVITFTCYTTVALFEFLVRLLILASIVVAGVFVLGMAGVDIDPSELRRYIEDNIRPWLIRLLA